MHPADETTSALDAPEPIEWDCEVAVVGLGAGGGMVFHELARQGVDVVGIEMGEYVRPEQVSQREDEMLPRLFQESGARTTEDFSVGILQGKGVGGSTVHNTNLCKRLPEPILEQWEAEYGLDWATGDQLQEDFAYVEDLLDVKRVPDERVNANNRVLERGLEKLGWSGGRLKHNRDHDDCQQSGFCEIGCPNDGKQNAAKVLVPDGLEAGGRVLTHARAERVINKDDVARGVRGTAVDPVSGREGDAFTIRADQVCVSASATGSAALLQQSDIPDPHRLAGTNLHMHPGATVVGLFDGPDHEPIRSWLGNPQSVDCTEFLDLGPDADNRAWIVPGAAHPAGGSMFVPGFGASHGEWMAQYPTFAPLIVMLHDHTSGRVHPAPGEQLSIHYSLDRDAYTRLADGMRAAGELLLAGGASEVLIPTQPPRRASTSADLDELSASDLGPLNPPLAAVHPMSTLWMGEDPRRSVVDPRGRHHHVDDLWVADGSLFPTSIGGPPQIPIYTMGRRVAREIQRGQ
jgi:choline dehydrogenase-like flavoprotein